MAIQEISVQDLAEMGEDVRLIDVREADEYASGHVAHAKSVPLGTVPDRATELNGSPVYLICRSGVRSYQACEFLAAYGHEVFNVSGGMLAWADAGFASVHES